MAAAQNNQQNSRNQYYPEEYYPQKEKKSVIDKEYVQSSWGILRICEAALSGSTFISLTAIDTYGRSWGREWIQFVSILTLCTSGFQFVVWASRCVKYVPFFIPIYAIDFVIAIIFSLFYAICFILVTIEAHASVITLYATSFLVLMALGMFLADSYKKYEVWKSPNTTQPNPRRYKVVKPQSHSAGPAVVNGIFPGGPWDPQSNSFVNLAYEEEPSEEKDV